MESLNLLSALNLCWDHRREAMKITWLQRRVVSTLFLRQKVTHQLQSCLTHIWIRFDLTLNQVWFDFECRDTHSLCNCISYQPCTDLTSMWLQLCLEIASQLIQKLLGITFNWIEFDSFLNADIIGVIEFAFCIGLTLVLQLWGYEKVRMCQLCILLMYFWHRFAHIKCTHVPTS